MVNDDCLEGVDVTVGKVTKKDVLLLNELRLEALVDLMDLNNYIPIYQPSDIGATYRILKMSNSKHTGISLLPSMFKAPYLDTVTYPQRRGSSKL